MDKKNLNQTRNLEENKITFGRAKSNHNYYCIKTPDGYVAYIKLNDLNRFLSSLNILIHSQKQPGVYKYSDSFECNKLIKGEKVINLDFSYTNISYKDLNLKNVKRLNQISYNEASELVKKIRPEARLRSLEQKIENLESEFKDLSLKISGNEKSNSVKIENYGGEIKKLIKDTKSYLDKRLSNLEKLAYNSINKIKSQIETDKNNFYNEIIKIKERIYEGGNKRGKLGIGDSDFEPIKPQKTKILRSDEDATVTDLRDGSKYNAKGTNYGEEIYGEGDAVVVKHDYGRGTTIIPLEYARIDKSRRY